MAISENVRLSPLVSASTAAVGKQDVYGFCLWILFMDSTILIQHFFNKYNLNLFGFVVSYLRQSLLIAMSLSGG